MESKKILSLPCAVIALLLICSASLQAEIWQIIHQENKTIVRFARDWAFDEVFVPVVSAEFWGNRLTHTAATLRINNRPFVSAVASQSRHLKFSLPGIQATEIELISLLSTQDNQTAEADFDFSAVPANVREIETLINDRIDREILFIRKNSCFSCHTALPLTMACKEAALGGYRIDEKKLIELGRSISELQLENGSFFFKEHPDYGQITTTLCAGVILSFLSDFSEEFMPNLSDIYNLLPGWADRDGLTRSDFYFKPVFIGQITSTLFESIIISTIYFKNAATNLDNHDYLRQRLLRLNNWAKNLSVEPFHRQIILMAGMPHIFQSGSDEKQTIMKNLKNLIISEPEGRNTEIQALAALIQKRLAPKEFSPASRTHIINENKASNWQIFLHMLQLFPVNAKKATLSADTSLDE